MKRVNGNLMARSVVPGNDVISTTAGDRNLVFSLSFSFLLSCGFTLLSPGSGVPNHTVNGFP